MTRNFGLLGGQPRVFISYARADGEQLANDLRLRLEAEGILCWQDRIGLEGGYDWWLQIVEVLNAVEFTVLIMTPAAILSETVQREWRYARQQGVCVYPVNGNVNLDFASLPRWMRDAHWYNLDQEWVKFVKDLNNPCEQRHVPFMAEDLPADFVERPKEFEALVSKLINESREEPIAITTALRGAGGYGKTTIAKAICHDERIQETFDDGILWVTLGERPDDLVGKLEDLIYILSRERFDFSGLEAATSRLVELLSDRDILLVIDDVWNAAHLKPFLQGGGRCARLITTRNAAVLPHNAQSIQVDAMQQDQAAQLLSAGLDANLFTGNETVALLELVARLGEWPLLLTLINGALREKVNRGQRFPDALTSINKALERRGLTAFDAHNPEERSQAVARTLGVSFELLSVNDRARYRELVIFPEDVDIPLTTVAKLWSMTGKLDEVDTDEVCEHLYELSLLLSYDLAAHTIRLHDVIRTYLQWNINAIELPVLHGQLLDAYDCKRWAELPLNEPYLWDHLAEHLIDAGRCENLIATVKDGSYLATKICARGVFSVEADLDRAERQLPTDTSLRLLKRSVVHMDHILNRCQTYKHIWVW